MTYDKVYLAFMPCRPTNFIIFNLMYLLFMTIIFKLKEESEYKMVYWLGC